MYSSSFVLFISSVLKEYPSFISLIYQLLHWSKFRTKLQFSHGFVPNGGRVYYLIRSQPPLLSPMLYEYYLATGDLDFVLEVSSFSVLQSQ